jgi:hypothetical protein
MGQVALVIREKGISWAGRPPRVTIHADEETARAALVDYVIANWQDEMTDVDLPESSDDAFDLYFENVLESYDIAPVLAQDEGRQ